MKFVYDVKLPVGSYPPTLPEATFSLTEMYKWARLCEHKENGDTNRYAPVLEELAQECDHITELGTRYGVSTGVFLSTCPISMTCCDIVRTPCIDVFEKWSAGKGVEFKFYEESSLFLDMPPTDLLFIDTAHDFYTLQGELARHADKVRKYIVMHDTTSFHQLKTAIMYFLRDRTFKLKTCYDYGNGLTVLERI